MHFSPSMSDQTGLGFLDDAMDGQFFPLPSTFGLNHDGPGEANTNLTIGLDPNELVSGRSRPSLGQLGLGQRLAELRRTQFIPQRVQVHGVIDFFPVKNQASLPSAEISVTEIVRTEEVVRTNLLTATFARDRCFTASDETCIHGQSSFQGLTLSMLNKVSDFFTFQKKPFHDLRHYETPRHTLYHCQIESNIQNHWFNPEPVSTFPLENLPLSYSNWPNVHLNELLFNPPPVSNPAITQNSSDRVDETDDDGRTHSLPCNKYGPYLCPKCRGLFLTSQSFAAHMGSHYKYESTMERRKRRAARNKRKRARLVRMRRGLTTMPESFNKPEERDLGNFHEQAQMTVKNEDTEKKEEPPLPETPAEEELIDVGIKDEPM